MQRYAKLNYIAQTNMKKVTIKENPFAGFEQFALTNEQTALVVGGGPFSTIIGGGNEGGGDLGGGGGGEIQEDVVRHCAWYVNGARIDAMDSNGTWYIGTFGNRSQIPRPTGNEQGFHCW